MEPVLISSSLAKKCANYAKINNKTNILVTKPILNKLNLKGLQLAQNLFEDSLLISEKALFLKNLTKNYPSLSIRLKTDDITDTYTYFKGSNFGSNPAFWATNQRTGELFYIKYTENTDKSKHIESEYLANKLYNLAGIKTADVKLVYMQDGSICLASPFLEGLTPLNKSEAYKAFAVDAWLGNWDGVLPGNTLSQDGSCIKIDCGGTLKYRAMGELKTNFNDEVDELVTLLSPQNPESASVYRDMNLETAIGSLKRVAQIPDSSIIELVEDKDLAKILINRKKYITKFLEELGKKRTSKKRVFDEFQAVATNIKNKSPLFMTLTPDTILKEIKHCYGEIEKLPSTEYLTKHILTVLKNIEKQKGNLTKKDLIDFLNNLSQEKFALRFVSIEQRELYQKMFSRLKELAEKNPIEDGESISKYFSKIEKIRKKRVKQLESGIISFIKSKLEYNKTPENIKPATLTQKQRQLAIRELEKTRLHWEKDLKIFLIPELNAKSTDKEIFVAWRAAHVADHTFADKDLEKSVMALGGRYNSSLKQDRISRFERVLENNYKQDFKYEPVYRWMHIDNPQEYIKSLPKRGEVLKFNSKQCCSINKHYAEIDFNDENISLNVKLVLHPKSQTSKAYLLGSDNEVVYAAGQEFKLIDTNLIEYINPETKMGCTRYEVHLQEI